MVGGGPVSSAFDDIVGQERAIAHLRAAVVAPVHAYLLVGPPGSGKRTAAIAFAAALLCPQGGCGTCSVCRRARAEVHPDLLVVERAGAFISIDQAREVRRLREWAGRAPMSEGDVIEVRQVFEMTEFPADVQEAAGKLSQTPPQQTVAR